MVKAAIKCSKYCLSLRFKISTMRGLMICMNQPSDAGLKPETILVAAPRTRVFAEC